MHFVAEGTKLSSVEAEDEPVVSVIVTSPSPACRDSEKYKSNFVEDGALSHAPFAGEYGMLLPDTAFSVRSIGVPPVLEQVFDDSVVKEKVAAAFM